MMKPFLICLLLRLILCQNPIIQIVNQTQNQGEWSDSITAQPDALNEQPQYFICGVSFLNRRWSVSLWNCNCGMRWYRWRRSYRCNWCNNYFNTMANGIKFIYCHYNSWSQQIEKSFVSSNDNSVGWTKNFMCPQNTYVNGVATRFDSSYGVNIGFQGIKLRCSTMCTSLNLNIQSSGSGAYQNFYLATVGNFATDFKIQHYPNYFLTGLSLTFKAVPIITNIQFSYNVPQNLQLAPIVLDRSETINCKNSAVSRQISLSKVFTFQNTWKIQNSRIEEYQILDNITKGVKEGPFSEKANLALSYYKSSSQKFAFNKTLNEIFSSDKNLTVIIPSNSKIVIQQIMEQNNLEIPFTAVVTFSRKSDLKFIVNQTVTGVWEGVVGSLITSNITQSSYVC